MPGSRRHPNHRPLHTLPPELRRTTVPPAVRAWVGRATGSAVVRWRRLPGASSTAVHLVVLEDGRRLVLRRYSWPGFVEAEPEAPGREVDALRFAASHGLPVPEVVAAEVVEGVPVLLMTRVAGLPVSVPDLAALAEVAARVHAVDAHDLGHDYFPWYADTTIGPPPLTKKRTLWERAIAVWHDEMPDYRPTLVHRDFHPGNVMWSRRRLTGIVDWPNACRGPGGCDVAHCRENLMRLSGVAAADSFRREYEALTGTTHHPYWEIASVLEHGPSWWTGPRLALAEPRLERALADLVG